MIVDGWLLEWCSSDGPGETGAKSKEKKPVTTTGKAGVASVVVSEDREKEGRKEGRKRRLPRLFGLGSWAVTRFVARLEPDGSEVDANAGRISSRLYPRPSCTFRVFCRPLVLSLSLSLFLSLSLSFYSPYSPATTTP